MLNSESGASLSDENCVLNLGPMTVPIHTRNLKQLETIHTHAVQSNPKQRLKIRRSFVRGATHMNVLVARAFIVQFKTKKCFYIWFNILCLWFACAITTFILVGLDNRSNILSRQKMYIRSKMEIVECVRICHISGRMRVLEPFLLNR